MMGRGFVHGYGSYGCGGMLPMLFVFVVIVLIVYLIVKRPRRQKEIQGSSQALSILNERLAKGEITTEEYEKIKKILHS